MGGKILTGPPPRATMAPTPSLTITKTHVPAEHLGIKEETMYFDDLQIGMTVEIAPAVIDKERMVDFAVLYDNIPLHTDEDYAKASPFGQLIAPGVMSFMSVWAKYLEDTSHLTKQEKKLLQSIIDEEKR